MSQFLIICSVIIVLFWLALFTKNKTTYLKEIIKAQYLDNEQQIYDTKKQIEIKRQKMEEMSNIEKKLFLLSYNEKDYIKKIVNLTKLNEKLLENGLTYANVGSVVGYKILDYFNISPENTKWFKQFVKYYSNCKNRESSLVVIRYKFAKMISETIIGTSFILCLSTLLQLTITQDGYVVGIILLVALIIMENIAFEELASLYNKRQDDIARELPNVVSKLALLTNAGMEMQTAWKQTAFSKHSTIYIEMQSVINNIDNGVSGYEAYNNFMIRCDNKFVSKLSTAIMQNLSKGNEKICELFNQMTAESWNERREYARRKGEDANGQLVIPLMMTFGGILFIVMAPLMLQFLSN